MQRATGIIKVGFDLLIMSKVSFPLSTGGHPPRRFLSVELPEGVPGDEDIKVLGLCPLAVAMLKLKRLITITIDEFAMLLACINVQRSSQNMEPVAQHLDVITTDGATTEAQQQPMTQRCRRMVMLKTRLRRMVLLKMRLK